MDSPLAEINYRALYGKLFSILISQFGVQNTSEIEDAIQNSFLKSLKDWNPNNTPDRKENWLYITAKNDLLNQLKEKAKTFVFEEDPNTSAFEPEENDLRIQTILLVASSTRTSRQAKIIFVLKNIFGLRIREINECTLLSDDAIYKIISRAKTGLRNEFKGQEISFVIQNAGKKEVQIAEEILYAVFNTGFDSFSEKHKSIVNEDLCLESFSLVKLLRQQYKQVSTSNLLSLFCFHVARIRAKVDGGKLISFFNQDRGKWNEALINLGFHYLRKPAEIDKFHVETLIVSKYMTAKTFSANFWNEIIRLYKILLQLSPSPIIALNYCFCLYKAGRKTEAMALLEKVDVQLPVGHIYLSLIKATLLKESNAKEAENITNSVLTTMKQEIRRAYLIENNWVRL